MVAETFFDEPSVVGVARNDDFPDALAGGPHIARRGGPMLLTPTSQLTGAPADYLCGEALLTNWYIYGGAAALSDAVADAVAGRINGSGC